MPVTLSGLATVLSGAKESGRRAGANFGRYSCCNLNSFGPSLASPKVVPADNNFIKLMSNKGIGFTRKRLIDCLDCCVSFRTPDLKSVEHSYKHRLLLDPSPFGEQFRNDDSSALIQNQGIRGSSQGSPQRFSPR